MVRTDNVALKMEEHPRMVQGSRVDGCEDEAAAV